MNTDPASAQNATAGPSGDTVSLMACALDGIGEGFLGLDRDWRFEFVNASAEGHLGTTRDALAGRTLWEAFPALSGTETERRFRAAGEARSSEAFEHRSILRPGRWLRMRVFPLPAGTGVSFTDVTERVRDERALRDSEERLRFALGVASIGTWEFSPGTGEIACDDRCREMFGILPGSIVDFATVVRGLHPDDRARVVERVTGALDPEGDGSYAVEFRSLGVVDGQERWLSARGGVMFDADRPTRFAGTLFDVTGNRRAAENQRLLINELNHRVKNNLSTVQAIAAQAFRSLGNSSEAQAAFTDRLMALARVHDVLTRESWDGAFLSDVVAAVLQSQARDAEGIRAVGGMVRLSPKTTLSIAMALHELASNATRHGALSVPGGGVDLSWEVEDGDGARFLRLSWSEEGGPRVAAPVNRGFGSRLIERGLAAELRGRVDLRYEAEGVTCLIEAPLRADEGVTDAG